jgi:hypothetical protein
MSAVFDRISTPQSAISHEHALFSRGIARPQRGPMALGYASGTPLSPQLEQSMREAYQTPFAPELLQTTQ